jgi:Subtilase family
MTMSPGESPAPPSRRPAEIDRQRVRDQIGALLDGLKGAAIVDTDDFADFGYICSNELVLVANDEDVGELDRYFNDRFATQGDAVESVRLDDSVTWGVLDEPRADRPSRARRYRLPARVQSRDKDLLATLHELERATRIGLAVPEHVVHLAMTGGHGSGCPATEPEETGFQLPWPERNPDLTAGAGVKVVVIDTGLDQEAPPNLAWLGPETVDGLLVDGQPASHATVRGEAEDPPLPASVQGPLAKYAGHGTFIAGVIRSKAPACDIEVIRFGPGVTSNGVVQSAVVGINETMLVDRLDAALKLKPDLISLSAGCTTRGGLPLMSFERWWQDAQQECPNLVLVAAAGNDSSAGHFWPASFGWAVGVGSLDRHGEISSFSNYGLSVDAFALGRNLINAFPNGTYHCAETPNVGDVRVFDHRMARWSGTSFAAPLVTGLIAAEMTSQDPRLSAVDARDRVLDPAQQVMGPAGHYVSWLSPPP